MTVEEWVEQWFERTYCNVIVALSGEWEAIVGDGLWSRPEARRSCTRRHADGYAAAAIATSEMWAAYGFLAGKAADVALLQCLRGAGSADPTAVDRVEVLFRTRVAITETIERMYALYERLAELLAAGNPMDSSEAELFAAWLEDGGITAGELRAAAAEVGVPVG
jgi:hypothetical protein